MNANIPYVRSKVNTRQRLVSASVEVFKNKGVAGATVDDLTSAAGFTRGAFYSSYQNKQEVFWDAFEMVTNEGLVELQNYVAELFDFNSLLVEGVDFPVGAPDPNVLRLLEVLDPIGITWHLLHTEAIGMSLHNSQNLMRLRKIRTPLIETLSKIFIGMGELPNRQLQESPQVIAETLLGVYTNYLISLVINESEQTTKVQVARTMELLISAFVKRT